MQVLKKKLIHTCNYNLDLTNQPHISPKYDRIGTFTRMTKTQQDVNLNFQTKIYISPLQENTNNKYKESCSVLLRYDLESEEK